MQHAEAGGPKDGLEDALARGRLFGGLALGDFHLDGIGGQLVVGLLGKGALACVGLVEELTLLGPVDEGLFRRSGAVGVRELDAGAALGDLALLACLHHDG